MTVYNRKFFTQLAQSSAKAAECMVPILVDWFKPATVIDVGCGVASWAAECKKCGVKDVHGVDGDWVPRDKLLIPAADFTVMDLSAPIMSHSRYDIALSLEVGEHLAPERADAFVEYLCSLSGLVVFSAASPGQGGTNHLNEQWPEYWAALFAKRGYKALDVLRPLLFGRASDDYWYVQNTVIYVASTDSSSERCCNMPEGLVDWKLARVVHPLQLRKALHGQRIWPRRWLHYTLKQLLPDLCKLAIRKPYEITTDDERLFSKIAGD